MAEHGVGEVGEAAVGERVEVERPASHTLLVTVRGDLDDPTAAHLRAVLREHLGPDGRARCTRVVLDLSRVTLLSGPAVELLRALRRRCRADRGHLVLVGTGRPAVHRPLRTSGVLPLFDTRATLRSALPAPARAGHPVVPTAR